MAEQKTVTEAVQEFVATLMAYLKQRGAEFVTAVLVQPLQKFAAKAALGCGGLVLLTLGIIFLGLFMVQGFAALFDSYLWAYLASAGVLILGAALLLWGMIRGGKEEGGAKHEQGSGRGGADDQQ